mgnify:CR=1 FL=1
MRRIPRLRCLLLIALLALAGAAPQAEGAALPGETAAALDSFFRHALETHRIAGLVAAVVLEGEVVFLRGFGLADVERGIPVDAETALFRIGSVTKLITATAAMQLVEQGKLALDTDVNAYLETFQIPDTFARPVTLRHLLTHTAGFDDRFLAIGVPDPARLEPLGPYLARRLPPRVQPPGEILNYSNFGIVLAAHLVELASDMAFAEYADEHVFSPLGMETGGFRQPLPPEMAARLATSYVWRDGGYVAAPYQDAASQVWPAGAYAVTAPDMARFLRAHLRAGGGILGEAALAEMHRTQFKNHPAMLRGQALGFHVCRAYGQRILWHTGRVNRFTGQLMLAPELDAGLYIACNTDSGDQIRTGAFELFARHFFPPAPPAPAQEPIAATPEALEALAGGYRQVRTVRGSLAKLAFLGREVVLTARGGSLLQRGAFSTAPEDIWLPVERTGPGPEGLVFEAQDSAVPRRLAFRTGPSGRVKYLCLEAPAFTVLDAFERLAWYESSLVHAVVAGICLLVFLGVFGGALWRALRRFRRGGIVEDSPAGHVSRRLAVATAAFFVAFAAGLAAALLSLDPYAFAFGAPPVLLALLALPLAGAAATALLLLALPFAIAGGGTRARRARAEALLVAGCGVVFLGLLAYWRLLGYYY